VQTVFEVAMAKPMGAHFGSRILFLPDGSLLLSVGDGGNPQVQIDGRPSREQAQNPASHLGKILRLAEDGTPPRDNPFLGRQGFLPEVWSWGHRNPQGLAWDPVRRVVWATEHGSQGGDELNRVRGGENHGWPLVTHSVEYRSGAAIAPERSRAGLVDPALVWSATTAPSGLAVYNADRFPAWRGDLFAGGLRSQDLRRIRLDAEGRVQGEEVLAVGRRIRDVRQGPDGFLYLLTDEPQGALLRLETAR
jgi:glucose/arabinose dehydrogenase